MCTYTNNVSVLMNSTCWSNTVIHTWHMVFVCCIRWLMCCIWGSHFMCGIIIHNNNYIACQAACVCGRWLRGRIWGGAVYTCHWAAIVNWKCSHRASEPGHVWTLLYCRPVWTCLCPGINSTRWLKFSDVLTQSASMTYIYQIYVRTYVYKVI